MHTPKIHKSCFRPEYMQMSAYDIYNIPKNLHRQKRFLQRSGNDIIPRSYPLAQILTKVQMDFPSHNNKIPKASVKSDQKHSYI